MEKKSFVKGEKPWVEKYRPPTLDHVVGNAHIVSQLAALSSNEVFPHLLLSGPPGVAKTSSILCVARARLKDQYNDAVLELNASDKRNPETVRTTITTFAQKKIHLPQGQYKLIILDEADNMTDPAQQTLRRTMDLFSETTRFVLICNDESKIIGPLQSRCVLKRFTALDEKAIETRLHYVMKEENVTLWTSEGIKAIVFTSHGDMRYALNTLQATWVGTGKIDATNVYLIVDYPIPHLLLKVIRSCMEKNFVKTMETFSLIKQQGHSSSDILQTLTKVVNTMSGLHEKQKLLFLKEIAVYHKRIISNGCDTSLQFSGMFAKLCRIV